MITKICFLLILLVNEISAFAPFRSNRRSTVLFSNGWMFNCGKMQHIFQFGHPQGYSYVYKPEFASEQAKQALENGTMYWKIDGACGMIKYTKEDGGLAVYERQDTRGKEPAEGLVPLVPGANTDRYESTKKHSYFLRKVFLHKSDGKKQKKIKQALLDAVERNRKELIAAVKTHGDSSGCLSVELVGQKYQQTPGVDVPVALMLHCEQKVIPAEGSSLPRTYDEVKAFLESYVAEGIIVEWEGKFWKILSSCVDPECVFKTDRARAMPPSRIYSST